MNRHATHRHAVGVVMPLLLWCCHDYGPGAGSVLRLLPPRRTPLFLFPAAEQGDGCSGPGGDTQCCSCLVDCCAAGAPGGEAKAARSPGRDPCFSSAWRVLAGSVLYVWSMAGRCLRWLGVAQWQMERQRATDRLSKMRLPDNPGYRAQRLSRVLSKPKLSVDVKKFQ